MAVDRYDVTAKAATEGEGLLATLTEDNRQKWTQLTRLRTRALLASRFNLAVHQETREFAIYEIYELHVDKNSPKADGLKKSNANLGTNFLGNVILGNGGDMHDLVMILGALLQKPKVDKTGLTDKYDFTLWWAPRPTVSCTQKTRRAFGCSQSTHWGPGQIAVHLYRFAGATQLTSRQHQRCLGGNHHRSC